MSRVKNRVRRQFLKSMSAGLPAAVLLGDDSKRRLRRPRVGSGIQRTQAIRSRPRGRPRFGDCRRRRHHISQTYAGPGLFGSRETDINLDGRLDIVSGENWYEQLPRQAGRSPRFVKHKFRDLGFAFLVDILNTSPLGCGELGRGQRGELAAVMEPVIR